MRVTIQQHRHSGSVVRSFTQRVRLRTFFAGLYVSLQEFARERRQRPGVPRQALVVFSDGIDTASHVSFENVSELARALDVTIYTITMHDGHLPQVIARNSEGRRATWEMR